MPTSSICLPTFPPAGSWSGFMESCIPTSNTETANRSEPSLASRNCAVEGAEALYLQFGPMVLRRCRWMLRDEQWARDAMQDVFVQLLRRPAIAIRYPSALLHRMATNICLNHLRDSKRRPGDSDDEILLRIASAEDLGGRIEARSFLDKLFGREKESTRAIAVMHLLDGFSLAEVAAMTGLSVSGVRKRLRTLRDRVKELETI